MSDDKKYYYIKLKDNYFERDNIKILEAQENGYIYSLIILKLYLKSAKHDGCLMMTDRIPYDPNKLDVLAKVLNHDVAHIKDALAHAKDLDLITIMDSGEIFMTEIQNFLGHSSSEADRKREYRRKLDTGQMSRQISDKYPPEKEIELEKEREREKEKNEPFLYLAELLYELHRKEDTKFNKPLKHRHTWANDIRLLFNDGRSKEEIESVIKWCQEPGCFWFPNILSGKKLRDKFDTMLFQMKRDSQNDEKNKPKEVIYYTSEDMEDITPEEKAEVNRLLKESGGLDTIMKNAMRGKNLRNTE